MTVIADTSVLSALAEIQAADLLPGLFGQVVVTETVYQEFLHPRAPATSQQLILSAPWMVRVPDPLHLLPETAGLDPGEASAISHAWFVQGPRLLLLDDASARKLCQALQLPITGTAGLIFAAAERGIVDFDTVVARLRRTTFRISDAVIAGLRQRLANAPAN